eukprot:246856-Pelagomonas_calceolata.AAC.5
MKQILNKHHCTSFRNFSDCLFKPRASIVPKGHRGRTSTVLSTCRASVMALFSHKCQKLCGISVTKKQQMLKPSRAGNGAHDELEFLWG